MRKFFIIIFLIIPAFMYAQKYNIKFNRISIESGLSQSTVYSISQDQKGFMWIGTEDGLNKYDGYNFKVFRKENNLSHNRITSIFADREHIWIGTLNGLNKFNVYQNKIEKYIFKNDSSGKNEISSILKDKSGNLWIGTDNGIFIYNREKDQLSTDLFKININDLLSSKNILKLYGDKRGIIWIGTLDGLNKVEINENKKDLTITRIDNISNNNILSICEDNNNVWIGTANGLNKLDREGRIEEVFFNSKEKFSLTDNFITSILVDRKNEVWIGTINGLNKYNRDKNSFYNYKHDHNDSYSLSNNSVLSLYEDSFGVIWAGTNLGLNKFDNNKLNFIHYKIKNNNLNNNILSIYESKSGVILLGTEFGLNSFNVKEEVFKEFFTNKVQKTFYESNGITTIVEDKDGTLWIGTEENGIRAFNPKTNKMKHYYHIKDKHDSLSNNNINTIFVNKKNELWIGTEKGLNFYEGTGKFKRYFLKTKNSNSIESIIEDKNGTLWIGTNGGGLNKFTKKNGFEAFISESNNYNDNVILCLYEDRKERLWLGTKGGLKHFYKKREFFNYKEKHGLPNDDIKGILEDSSGNLWISTNRGLSRFNPEQKTFHNFFLKDGLQSNEFNQNSCIFSKNGKMYFGGKNGFNVFDPKKIGINHSPPKIVITSFKKFNKEFKLKNHISNTKEIKLANDDKLISFNFVALNYSNPSENKYSWKLEGLNNTWMDLGTKRNITITNLTSGTYFLKIKTSNCDGIWNETGTAIKLLVPTPFNKTFGFYIILLVLSILLFLIIFKIKTNSIKKQKKKLEVLVKEKTAQLTEANIKLSILAKEDGLTNLMNKRTFSEHFESNCDIARREKIPISLIMIDLDYFKIYNDTLGHQAGDNCLKVIGEVLNQAIKRPGDIVARYGGEEFIVMLYNTLSNGATFVAKKIQKNLEEKNIIFNKTEVPNVKRVTASFGISTFIPTEKFNTSIIILAADTALYQAKSKGRNRIFVFNSDETA